MEVNRVPPHHLVQLGLLQEQFEAEAARFLHIMSNGDGIRSVDMREVLTNLTLNHIRIAAHLDAARDMNKEVNLETGLQALNMLRAMENEKEE